MTRIPWSRIAVGVVGPVAPLLANEPTPAVVRLHPYLHCLCGDRIWHGTALSGAPILVCRSCNSLCDQRRFG